MTRMLEVSLVTLGDPNTMTGGYLYHRRMAEAAPRHGARLKFVSWPARPWPVAVLAGREALRAAGAADVCLLDSICASLAAPWLQAATFSVPVAAILHQPPGGIDAGRLRTFVQARLDLLAYRRCSTLVLASAALKGELPPDFLAQRRVVVVAPGRDAAPQHARAPGMRAHRSAALLCVGNWIERKGLLALLEALAMLPESAATLHLAGDPWTSPAYGRKVWLRLVALDLLDRVVVHGPVSPRRLGELYGGADVFVLPSLREPYGTVYGEAMAQGLPVVGWRAGNLPHLAADRVEGLLVAPGDVVGLANALRQLSLDEALRRHMGDAARRRAQSLPTWEQSAHALFDVLRDVAA